MLTIAGRPGELTHTMIVQKIDSGDGNPWKAGSGREFTEVSDYDPEGELNPDTAVYYLYKPAYWTTNHNGVVFALITENGEAIDSSQLNLVCSYMLFLGNA